MTFVTPLLGGMLIGLAVALLLFTMGRVAGISGILGGLVAPLNHNTTPNAAKLDRTWRAAFLLGLTSVGLVTCLTAPSLVINDAPRPLGVLIFAGLLVGYGTRLGGGCTSGHGVCGISRFAPRSIAATLVFMTFGILTVTLHRWLGAAS